MNYSLDDLEKLDCVLLKETMTTIYWNKKGKWYDWAGRQQKELELIERLNTTELLGVEKEMVDHPSHYGGESDTYEAIKVIEAWGLCFHLGNVAKYICRTGKKDDELQELKKARWYLDRKIQNLENNNKST